MYTYINVTTRTRRTTFKYLDRYAHGEKKENKKYVLVLAVNSTLLSYLIREVALEFAYTYTAYYSYI